MKIKLYNVYFAVFCVSYMLAIYCGIKHLDILSGICIVDAVISSCGYLAHDIVENPCAPWQ